MERVLVTYATRALGLRVIKMLSEKMEVEKATSDEVPVFMKSQYTQIPTGGNPVFAHEILKLALDRDCAYILPLGVEEVMSLSEATLLFEEYGIRVLGPGQQFVSDVHYLDELHKDSDPLLLIDGVDVFSGGSFEQAQWDGLCLASDSGEDFVLLVV